MKKYKITREQILELSNQNSYTKSRLLSLFPEAFEDELTGWLKTNHPGNENWLMYASKDNLRYGIDGWGDWFHRDGKYNTDENYDRLATHKEVEKALIDEAKKRGYREGVMIEDIYIGTPNTTVSSNNFDWEELPFKQKSMALRDSEGSILFVDGQWTPIIELTLEDRVTILENKLK